MKEVIELLESKVFILEYNLKAYERGATQPYGDAPYCKKKILELNEAIKYFNEAIKILNKKNKIMKIKNILVTFVGLCALLLIISALFLAEIFGRIKYLFKVK